jgi:sporulation integral membrane protein YtvI
MLRSEIEKYQHLLLKIIAFITLFILGYLVIRFMFVYLAPFIIAFVLSMLMEPLVKLFQKLKLGRGVSVGLSILIFLGTFITIAVFAITRITYELGRLLENLPNLYANIYNIVIDLVERGKNLYLQLTPEATNIAQDVLKKLFTELTTLVTQTTSYIINMITSLPGILILLIIIVISTFFLTKDKYFIRDFLFRQLPQPWGARLTSVKDDLFGALLGFIRAISILISFTFIETFIGLSILGVDYAFILAIIIGLLDILPIIGTGSVLVPWAVTNFVMGDAKLGIWLLVLYAVIIIVRYTLEPKIYGHQLGIHPLVALISMFVGLQLLGLPGVLIGPSTVIILKACQHAGIIPKFK